MTGFVNSAVGDATDVGGAWEARLVAGVRRPFAIELAYVGSASPMSSAGLSDGGTLVSHGAEGTLRLNLMADVGGAFLGSAVFFGLGVANLQVANAAVRGTSSLRDSDNVATLPVGFALVAGSRRLFVEARAAYRFTYNVDLVTPADRGQLNRWTLGANFGAWFD